MKGKGLLPVLILTVAAFVFNTSESAPIGLLTDISADLGISEARAGFLISAYAWVVAIMSLPLILVCSHLEYKRLMTGIVGLFVASHVVSGLATGYWMLMFSRMGVACAHALFWAVATPVAVRISPKGKQALAMSLIMTGTSVAQIVGMPMGRMIGLALGWRMTFICIGALAAIVLVFMISAFPRVENDTDFSIGELPRILRNRRLLAIYAIVILLVTGHFVAYSYIEPFMLQTAGLQPGTITVVLMVFGLAGIIASAIFSKGFPARRTLLTLISSAGTALALALLEISAASLWSITALCVFWGIAITMMNLVFQAELMDAEKKATTVAMALYSGLFNVGIAAGPMIGGWTLNGPGLARTGYIGAAIALAGSAVSVWFLLRGRNLEVESR